MSDEITKTDSSVGLKNLLAEKIGNKTKKEIIIDNLAEAMSLVDDVHFMVRDYNDYEGKTWDVVETIVAMLEELNNLD